MTRNLIVAWSVGIAAAMLLSAVWGAWLIWREKRTGRA